LLLPALALCLDGPWRLGYRYLYLFFQISKKLWSSFLLTSLGLQLLRQVSPHILYACRQFSLLKLDSIISQPLFSKTLLYLGIYTIQIHFYFVQRLGDLREVIFNFDLTHRLSVLYWPSPTKITVIGRRTLSTHSSWRRLNRALVRGD